MNIAQFFLNYLEDKVPASEEEGEPAGYSLLVVEDTTDMLEFLAKNLGNTYTIHTATNGKEALEGLETTTVDLIISDIVMPHMDGFELLKSIRSDNWQEKTPTVRGNSRGC